MNIDNISIEKIENGYVLTYVASQPARIVKDFCATREDAILKIEVLLK